MPFDPNQPFEVEAPAFNPDKPFEAVESPAPRFDPNKAFETVDTLSPSTRAAFAPPGENPAGVVRQAPATLLESEAQRIALQPPSAQSIAAQRAKYTPEQIRRLDEGSIAENLMTAPPGLEAPMITPEQVESFFHPEPGLRSGDTKVRAEALAGLLQTAAGFWNFAASPIGVAGLVSGAGAALPGLAGAVGKATIATFALDALKNMPDAVNQYNEAIDSGDPEAIARTGSQLVINLGVALGASKGTMEGIKGIPASEAMAVAAEANAVKTDAQLAALDQMVNQLKTGPIERIAPAASEALKIQESVLNETATTTQQGRAAPAKTETIPREAAPSSPRIEGQTQGELVGIGGAVPSEFEAPAKGQTSIKNAKVDVERAQRGLPPVVEPVRREFGEVWDRAIAEIDRDATIQDRLIGELRENPRALTDTEDALLLHRQVDLQNEYAKATRDLTQAFDDGRLDAVEIEKARVADLSDRLLDLYEVGKKAGTETGRGLAARKMMANEDFTLASLEMQKRAGVGGRPLTDGERAELVKIADEYKAKSEALEERLATQEQRLSESVSKQTYDELVKEVEKQPKVNPYIIGIAEKIVSGLEKRADAARARLRGKLFTISPDVLFDLAEIGAAQIGRVGLDFSKWSIEMVRDIGERVKPHLDAVWTKSQELIDSESSRVSGTDKKVRETVKRTVKKQDSAEREADIRTDILAKVEAGEDVSLLVQRLAREFIGRGIKDREKLIDAVHEFIRQIDPEMTRRDTMDAISGYGKFKLLSKDEISVELRDLKGQMQQLGKLEDMQSGKAPSKTGVERRTPSDEERRLIKQVEEAKKRGGYKVTDPETQLRSALQSVKTRLRNDITDLEQQIRTGERIVPEKRGVEYDAEATAMKQRRDALREDFDALFGKREMSNEQRVKLAMTAVEKSITELERRIKVGEVVSPKRVSKTPNTKELVAARARRDALSEQLKELRDLDASVIAEKEASRLESKKKAIEKDITEKEKRLASGDVSAPGQKVNRPAANPEIEALNQRRDALSEQIAQARKGPPKTPEERALQSYKARTANRIAELEKKTAAGDFSAKKRSEIALDPEATNLKFELEKVKQKWTEARFNDQLSQRSIPKKIFDTGREVLNLSRAIITSIDFSAVLRQGGFIALAHPVRASKSLPDMFRAFGSEKAQFRTMEEIRSRQNWPLYKQSKLYIAEDGISLSKMEEAYMSRWGNKIPGVAASQRAYTTFLNKLRADSFDAMTATMSRSGKVTPIEANAIANFINVATGRGELGPANQAAVALNTIFFSPRYAASRFQIVAGQPFYRGTMRARKAVASEYARFLIGAGVVYGLSQLADASVELDPRSSDFAKIRVGNTRIDPLAGLIQVTVLLSRLASGETKSIKGRVTAIRGDTPFGSPDAPDVLKQFLRSKLSPAFGAALDTISGKDIIGQPVTPIDTATKLLVPISMGDIYEAMQEQGLPAGVALGILSLFGFGIQTFDENKKREKPERK